MPEGDRNLVGCVCSHYRANGIVCLCYSSVLYAVGLFVPQAAHCRLCYKDSSPNGGALHCVSAHNIIFGLRSGDNRNGGVILRGGVALTAELGTFWFPGVLFLTLILFNLMSEGIRAWVCIAAFVVANFVNHYELFLPLNIQAVPIALFYMTAGNIIKKYLPTSEFGRIVEEKINPIAVGIIAVLGVVILVLPDVFLDIKYNNYGIPVVSILLSLVMVAIVAVLCVRIAKVPVIGKFLAFCGKASLFIMFVHQYVHFRIFATQGRLLTLLGTIALSLLLYIAAMRWRTTRLMLCGEIKK